MFSINKLRKKQFSAGLAVACISALAFSGCGGSSDDPLDDLLQIVQPQDDETGTPVVPVTVEPTGLISGVTSGAQIGEYRTGSPPQNVGTLTLNPISDGSDVFIIAGGSTELPVTSTQPFSTIYVLSDSDGYFEIMLPAATLSTVIVVSYSPDELSAGQQQIDVSVSDSGGAVSSTQSLPVQSVEVGTGELQVSVSWDKPTDVDLWLVEPDGETIAYFNKNSDNGGSLDLDSNPGCFIDNINNENITYDGVTPPTGEYIVIVDYFSSCNIVEPTNYTVTVRANGLSNIYSGQLTAGGGRDVEVTRVQVR